MKYLIFILLQSVSITIFAQKVGQIPHYADFSDFTINVESAASHTFAPKFADSSKFALGGSVKLGVSYKPKNSLVAVNLYTGLCSNRIMFDPKGLILNYSTLGLSAICYPNRNGNWFAQIGAEYCTLISVKSDYPDFLKKEDYEPKYSAFFAQIGIKAIQYKQFSFWLQTGYRHTLTPFLIARALDSNAPANQPDIYYLPLYLADLQLGITLRYHTSKYYAKK